MEHGAAIAEKPRAPAKSDCGVDDVEIAVAEYIDWFNQRLIEQYRGERCVLPQRLRR
ncbi:hypothetical protein [Rhodococcus marinonascens]|uniref:hypothetical protein n=1 Tax=Rhodococcus marinonascens TaxID=38311 RepID=UPI000ADBFD5A|nr:hypothetical protein [Rhodococcus marinonascens]